MQQPFIPIAIPEQVNAVRRRIEMSYDNDVRGTISSFKNFSR